MPGLVYAGVPFLTSFVHTKALEYGATVALLDDWTHGWPLLQELGDRPEEWYEPKGRGFKKLK